MLNSEQLDAIERATWDTLEVFRGVLDARQRLDFALAMLLLKVASDNRQHAPNSIDHRAPNAALVVPAGADFPTLLTASTTEGNGRRIQAALRSFESANSFMTGVFKSVDFDATALGNAAQKDRLLSALLWSFTAEALDFSAAGGAGQQAAAVACDSLIRLAASASGKHGGDFFTPPAISQLLAELMQPAGRESVCDPCCGSGSLLITCDQKARETTGADSCALYGQEKAGSTWALAKINMLLHGVNNAHLEWGDTLRDPKLLTPRGSLQAFDVVVSCPPFSLREWGHEAAEFDSHGRYKRGIPPRTAGDYAFLSHMVATLKPETGRMAAVVSHGVLFRGGAEHGIREKLLRENLIEAVISLPAKLFQHTAIPVAIIVLRHGKADTRVRFIDASHEYTQGKSQNALRQEDLARIVNAYQSRQDDGIYARLVNRDEIYANECNLNVTRYINATAGEESLNLDALRAERALLSAELAELEAHLAVLLKEGQ